MKVGDIVIDRDGDVGIISQLLYTDAWVYYPINEEGSWMPLRELRKLTKLEQALK